jgi:outer membrane lipoprotein-sorting protein
LKTVGSSLLFSGPNNSILWQIPQNPNMNYKPQIRFRASRCVGLLALMLLFWHPISEIQAQTAEDAKAPAGSAEATPSEQPGNVPVGSEPEAAVPAAQELLSQMRARLDGLESLRCTLHETAVLSGMKFVAQGQYFQASGNRVRLEFQIAPVSSVRASDADSLKLKDEAPAAIPEKEAAGSLLQVSNGSVLYSWWKNGKDSRVTRRNVAAILKAADESKLYDPARALQDLGLGGLNALFARLETSMEFSKVRRERQGEASYLILTGRWNQKFRKEVFQIADDVEVLPQEFLPEYVRIYIDEATTLPRRIQYLKRSQNPGQKLIRPIITLDLREIVLNEAVDDSRFVFTPPENVREDDITEQTVQSILQAANPVPQNSETTVPSQVLPGESETAPSGESPAPSSAQPSSEPAPQK